jgi:cytochrome b561
MTSTQEPIAKPGRADAAASAPTTSAPTAGDAPPARPRSLVFLHWLTVLLLVIVGTLALTRDEVSGRAARQWLLEGHRHVGLLVLALAAIRIAMRIRLRPWRSIETSPLLRAVAWLTHAALYLLLLAMPLIGWALSNAEGKPVHWLGLTLPTLVMDDEDLADRLLAWHQGVAVALLALIALHAGAALWHHFVRRDEVLRLMWRRRHD